MRKILYSIILTSSLFAATDYSNDSLDTWRDGFITAYKALKVDSATQGVTSKEINTEDFIIYFDASTQDVSDWDKLMVQMFGYSSSIHKPIRTVENFIIFDSYNNKATALQEMESLNSKIFKNSEKYKLKIFDNSILKRKFYNDKALLMSELKELETLLNNVNKIKLSQKEKELEENQKVALVYVDNNTNKVLPTQTFKRATVTEVLPEPINLGASHTSPQKNTPLNRVFYAEAKKNADVFSKPSNDSKNRLYSIEKGKVLEIESINENGWYKLKNKNEYVGGHLFKEVDKKNYEKDNSTSNPIVINKPVAVEQTIDTNNIVTKTLKKENVKIDLNNKIVNPVNNEIKDKFFTLTDKEAVVYKLDNYTNSSQNYPVSSFVPIKTMKNDYNKLSYTDIVKDTDGNQYVKLKNINSFIDLKAVYIIK